MSQSRRHFVECILKRMDKIIVHKFNETYDKIECEPAIEQELNEYFTFEVPNFYFMKKKNPRLKRWDGKKHLFSKQSKKLYVGLRSRLENFAQDRNIEVEYSDVAADFEFSLFEAQEFI